MAKPPSNKNWKYATDSTCPNIFKEKVISFTLL